MEPLNHHAEHPYERRGFLKLAGVAGLSWLTPIGQMLALQAEQAKSKAPAQSVIVLWMAGGPSQLETFDPHADSKIAGDTRAINTAVKGVQLAEGFGRLAEEMAAVSLIRSMVSKEGDHERGTYTLKTGYRPDPTLVHPSIGAICCHEMPQGKTEIPRHVSILPNMWPARGGFLGDEFDAFKLDDPASPLPDVTALVDKKRDVERVQDLSVVEKAFARGRQGRVDATLHQASIKNARTMMTSEQLKAFDTSKETAAVRAMYGDSPFGRSCLAARRLIEVGVRCVEVTLDGWDTHVNNHELCARNLKVLDPAFSALLTDLRQRDLLKKTVVLCMGEFGRTPQINPGGGRDHWPTGFSVALAGGNLRAGTVIGQTDPKGSDKPVDPVSVGDLHATVMTALGIDPAQSFATPIGRPMRLSDGKPVAGLLTS